MEPGQARPGSRQAELKYSAGSVVSSGVATTSLSLQSLQVNVVVTIETIYSCMAKYVGNSSNY